MANRDGTGPEGRGPKTGRQMGNCKDATPMRGGFGRGRGFRNKWYWREPIVLSKEEKKKILEAEKKQIEQELKNL